MTEKPTAIVPAAIAMRELDVKASLAYDHEDVCKCLKYLAAGRFRAGGLPAAIIPLADLQEKGFDRLAVDKNLIRVVVAP